MNWYFASPNSFGRAWPSSSLRSGLGSNVAMWLGPPDMKRKMTDRALTGSSGLFGASGSTVSARSDSSCNSEASARPPKPQKASRMNARRFRVRRTCGRRGQANCGRSGDIQKSVEVKESQRELGQRLLAEKAGRQFPLVVRRRSPESEPVRPLDDRHLVAARFLLEPAGQRRGQLVRRPTIQQLQRLRGVSARLPSGATGHQGRRVESFQKREPQVAFGDQINRTPVVLGCICGDFPL